MATAYLQEVLLEVIHGRHLPTKGAKRGAPRGAAWPPSTYKRCDARWYMRCDDWQSMTARYLQDMLRDVRPGAVPGWAPPTTYKRCSLTAAYLQEVRTRFIFEFLGKSVNLQQDSLYTKTGGYGANLADVAITTGYLQEVKTECGSHDPPTGGKKNDGKGHQTPFLPSRGRHIPP